MSKSKQQILAIEGWFATDPEPHLLGSRCRSCASYFFPKEAMYCRNPGCASSEFEDVPLSRTGTIWSFTENHYRPPAPSRSSGGAGRRRHGGPGERPGGP